MLNLFINNYIEQMLKKVRYEYDQETKSWCAILKELPGVFAQADTVEEARQQVAEVIEDYLIVSLQKNHKLPDFNKMVHINKLSYV
ncbi:MAG: type II toxin-antitoxin system HicB family antitoxin [Patescibacteria group bacterium]|nr:type II toxin-antitoxin system HicB family antitoxin [Patescibacteria group bacterium]